MINHTVVVYEEDTAVRQAAQSVLEAEGYTVIVASDAASLLALTTTHSPWLLVLAEDAMGLAPSHSIREQLLSPHMAVLTLTGWYQGMRGIPHRGNMALTKPCNPQELKQFVKRLRTEAENSNQ